MAKEVPAQEEEKKVKFNRENFRESLSIFRYLRPYMFGFVVGMLLLGLSSLVFMVFPWLSGEMIDIAQGNGNYGMSLKDIGWILIIVLFAQGFVSYTRVVIFAHVSEKAIRDLRRDLYNKMITLNIAFYEENRIGELVSRLTSDVDRLYNTFSITLAEFSRQVIILVVGIGFLIWSSAQLAGIMLLVFPIVVVGGFFFGRYIRRLSKERQQELANTNVILSETTQNIQTVKAYTNEKFESNRYSTSLERLLGIAIKFAKGRAIFSVYIVSIIFGALFFVVYQGALLLQEGQLEAGQLVSFFLYTAIIGAAIGGLGNFLTEILGALGATERIREILATESEVELNALANLDKPLKLYGEVEYKDVHFHYPTRTDIEVLKGLSMKIEAGKKIALVGASGAGKSTILQLLQRFYNIQQGEILVDGKNIHDYPIELYRFNLGLVPQEVLLFGGSIRENLLYGKPDATEAELIEAAKQSNSWEFIDGFPEGLDTTVGERGLKLSGGQKQRIAIARAILRNPAILLLDEATSALDAESEQVVQDALNKLMEGRTSLIIAHRLATIRDADQIYVVDKGRVIEQGTHDELTQMDEGVYNSLAKLQFDA